MSTSSIQRWEYHREQVGVGHVNKLDARLSDLGGQGWELVGMATTFSQQMLALGAAPTGYVHLIFKRPKV